MSKATLSIDIAKIELEITTNLRTVLAMGKTPAFIYNRVSTEGQEQDGFSLANQIEGARAYAERSKLEPVYFFTVSESSWKSEGRRTFHTMVELSKKYGVHNLIFKCTDRMSRNYNDIILIKDLIDNHNYSIHFWETNKCFNKAMNYDEDFMWIIELAVAKRHSDKVSHDIKQAYRYKAINGIAPGPPPFGYKYVSKEKDKNNYGHFQDPETIEVVQYIFDLFDNKHLSLREITKILNAEGYKTPTGLSKWEGTGFLGHILGNIFYTGYFYYDNKLIKGKHAPIITLEQFEERKKRLSNKFCFKPRDHGKSFSLSGLLRHAECGRMLTGEIKKEKYMFWSHEHERGDFQRIPERGVMAKIDAAIGEIILSADFEQLIQTAFENAVNSLEDTNDKQEGKIKARLGRIKVEKKRVLDLYAKGKVDEDIYEETIKAYEFETTRLTNDLKSIGHKQFDVLKHIAEILRSIRNFREIYFLCNIEDKGKLLKTQVDVIYIHEDHAEIVWNDAWRIIIDPDLMLYKNLPVIKQKSMLPR